MQLSSYIDSPALKIRKNSRHRSETFGRPSQLHEEGFLKKSISDAIGEVGLKFISEHIDLEKESTIFLSHLSAPAATQNRKVRNLINLQPLNRVEDLNAYFRAINKALPDAGIYIGCVESYGERRSRLLAKYPSFFANIMWILDFVINRVLPKLTFTRRLYSFLSRRKYNVVSKAEILGRLSYAGFEMIGHKKINNLFYFSVIKTGLPKEDKNPSYGLIFKMKRISKAGKIIGVYKIRTMHPYSEYLQDYVVKMHGYNETGKPNHDFRLTSWGKVFRKLHLDELLQLINVAKGDLNLVGVRPLSQVGFQALPPDLQIERIKYKPGCIPPNVALGLTGFEGVIRSERIYLRAMKKNALLTNFTYFWMALFNIIKRKNFSA